MNAIAAAVPMQAQPQPGFDPSFFLMLGTIFLIFYLLVLRPENRKRKAHEDSVKAAGKGDTVTTTGGIQGKVVGTTDDVVTVEIATLKNGEKVKVKIARANLASVARDDDADDKKGGGS